MLLTALISLLAGALSVLAPCVLPFLPVIVGGSLGQNEDRRRPFIITGSLVVSLVLFTLLLKASTALINIDPRVWTIGSGVLVILLGLTILFPQLWARISARFALTNKSHKLLHGAQEQKSSVLQAVGIGAALGPVFSSCSPTYAWVIATVLPARPAEAVFYLSMYCIGMAGLLLAIALAGRKLVEKLKWAANPKGWFQRGIGVLMIVVGLFVATGFDKQFQAWAADKVPSAITNLEHSLLDMQNSDEHEESKSSSASSSNNQAPDFQEIESWINSDPLSKEKLKGKVVLVDFWTYSCINCVRTQPYLNEWYEKYHDKGFEIVGVHAPEFAFEKVRENVERAVQEAGIKYPVALDNEFKTWRAYQNQYWPAKYLIDQEGNIQYTHFGEGAYEETEKEIQKLLGTSGEVTAEKNTKKRIGAQTPETYLGYARAQNYVGKLEMGEADYPGASSLNLDQWTFKGKWNTTAESSEALADGAELALRFHAKEVFLVMSGTAGANVQVKVNGKPVTGGDVKDGTLTIDGDRMYKLVDLPEYSEDATLTLTFEKGVKTHAFTFG
ncbi:cytochrome c biogenesis protein DipZ [Canibacter zhoujuaniae]|uniref:cytochrome c biogenesis protein DipZ n=1 Tax=Canibacter zhoujuaniae TaxID=2708343 RepID=UPI0014202407|nr:cytochrome c biogenesis protein DipZ [Canibacter zhoujuaniae]